MTVKEAELTMNVDETKVIMQTSRRTFRQPVRDCD